MELVRVRAPPSYTYGLLVSEDARARPRLPGSLDARLNGTIVFAFAVPQDELLARRKARQSAMDTIGAPRAPSPPPASPTILHV